MEFLASFHIKPPPGRRVTLKLLTTLLPTSIGIIEADLTIHGLLASNFIFDVVPMMENSNTRLLTCQLELHAQARTSVFKLDEFGWCEAWIDMRQQIINTRVNFLPC